MTKWTSKDTEKKEYKSSQFSTTDYNIPRITYKAAFVMSFATIGIYLFISPLMLFISGGYEWPGVIVCGCLVGFTIAYCQFFISSEKKATKSFYGVWIAFAILAMLVNFISAYTNIFLA